MTHHSHDNNVELTYS